MLAEVVKVGKLCVKVVQAAVELWVSRTQRKLSRLSGKTC